MIKGILTHSEKQATVGKCTLCEDVFLIKRAVKLEQTELSVFLEDPTGAV